MNVSSRISKNNQIFNKKKISNKIKSKHFFFNFKIQNESGKFFFSLFAIKSYNLVDIWSFEPNDRRKQKTKQKKTKKFLFDPMERFSNSSNFFLLAFGSCINFNFEFDLFVFCFVGFSFSRDINKSFFFFFFKSEKLC